LGFFTSFLLDALRAPQGWVIFFPSEADPCHHDPRFVFALPPNSRPELAEKIYR
jgi:hypothetical protein